MDLSKTLGQRGTAHFGLFLGRNHLFYHSDCGFLLSTSSLLVEEDVKEEWKNQRGRRPQ